MFNNFKYTLLNGWNLVRILRLTLAVFALIAAFSQKDPMMGMIGSVFGIQAIFNVGCCGLNGCEIKENRFHKEEKEIVYEKIKTKDNGNIQ